MAFCTSCGATVEGAFCKNCGTPAASSGAAASVPLAQPAPLPPGQRKTSPIVWILVIVVGLFVLGAIGTLATGYFLVHKVRQAGFDTDLLQRNPGLAISKMVVAALPNAEVIKTDEGAGTITVRDKTTGKVVTMSFDDARKGKFHFEAEGPDHEKASLDVGGSDAKVPADIPVYPGAKVQGNFSVTGNDANGQGSAAQYQFSTPDPPAQVLAYYHGKLEGSGMKLALNTNTTDGGMLMAEDDTRGQAITVIVGKSSEGTSISLTTRVKK
jgi:hypothetical protein